MTRTRGGQKCCGNKTLLRQSSNGLLLQTDTCCSHQMSSWTLYTVCSESETASAQCGLLRLIEDRYLDEVLSNVGRSPSDYAASRSVAFIPDQRSACTYDGPDYGRGIAPLYRGLTLRTSQLRMARCSSRTGLGCTYVLMADIASCAFSVHEPVKATRGHQKRRPRRFRRRRPPPVLLDRLHRGPHRRGTLRMSPLRLLPSVIRRHSLFWRRDLTFCHRRLLV